MKILQCNSFRCSSSVLCVVSPTKINMKTFIWLGFFINCLVADVMGHGRLIEPPSRASMWRYGFDTPHDYNDHESYCGGFTRQWQRNGGKCGICGDPYDAKPVNFFFFLFN